jgi:hypothetical protein
MSQFRYGLAGAVGIPADYGASGSADDCQGQEFGGAEQSQHLPFERADSGAGRCASYAA